VTGSTGFPIIDVTRACAQTLDNANPVEAVTPRGDRAQRLESPILPFAGHAVPDTSPEGQCILPEHDGL